MRPTDGGAERTSLGDPAVRLRWEARGRGGPRRRSLVAAYPDRLVESPVPKAVEPASLELSLRAAGRVEQDRGRLHALGEQRGERAGSAAGRAWRPYDAVDPQNRPVARESERPWGRKPAERRRPAEDRDRFRSEQPRRLRTSGRERITSLAADLPGPWHSPTTTGGGRRAIVRRLIERAGPGRDGGPGRIAVVIRRRGGTAPRHALRQGLRAYRSPGGLARLRGRTSGLRGGGQTADAIAEALDREGYQAARGGRFIGGGARQLLARFGREGAPAGVRGASDLPGPGERRLPAPAAQLGVEPIVVHRRR